MIRLTQRFSQIVMLRVENSLNQVFGAQLNPLYQLGAIAYSIAHAPSVRIRYAIS